MTQNIVIDTNIVVSALLKSESSPAATLQKVITGDYRLCFSVEIIKEYTEVLARPKLKINQTLAQELLDLLINKGVLVAPPKSTLPLPDEKDRVFYDTAKYCNALLVTGNSKHFPNEESVVTATDFLAIL